MLDSASAHTGVLTTSRSSAAATFSFTSFGRLASYSSCTANAAAASAAAAASSASRLCRSSACRQTFVQTCRPSAQHSSAQNMNYALDGSHCLVAHSHIFPGPEVTHAKQGLRCMRCLYCVCHFILTEQYSPVAAAHPAPAGVAAPSAPLTVEAAARTAPQPGWTDGRW